MPAAPLPHDEPQRLEVLRGYQILDTLPEHEYDDIVGIASRICETPIALISLVDTDRQWFKARVGVDVDETHRDAAFCAHAILDKHNVLSVGDATRDPRFFDNPLVTGSPNIRFYAGSPLVTPQGKALGTLCVIDSAPRSLSTEQLKSLEALGRQTVALLELRGRTTLLERCRSELEQSNESLRSFSYAASHDMKQPIRGIRSLCDFFVDDFGDQLDEPAIERVALIRKLADRAHNMMDQMLHCARVGCHAEDMAMIDLNEVLAAVQESLLVQMSSDNLVVEAMDMPETCGHSVLIGELFQNLLSNAIKYNDSTYKSVRIGYVKRCPTPGAKPITAFFVADNGIGIQATMHSEVFSIFRRLHAEDAYGGGSGAGLAIAKKIVENHDGKIWIDPAYDAGTCFWFTLEPSADDLQKAFRYEEVAQSGLECVAV